MVKDGKIRVVTGFGAMLISASEIERICGNTNKNGGAAL